MEKKLFKKKYAHTSIAQNLIRTLSKRGLCSRTQAAALVQAGKVKVNGRIVKNPGYRVRDHDKIWIEGQSALEKRKRYFIFHKPKGVVTTRSDEKGRKTVYDYLKGLGDWVAPVGRLDQDTEGLLLFTNDTAWAHRMTEPSYQVPRVYQVWIQGRLSKEDVKKMERGLEIGRNEKSGTASVKILKEDEIGTQLEMTLTEGKNREIRRIFQTLGKTVIRLVRIQYGPFRLGTLKPSEFEEVIV